MSMKFPSWYWPIWIVMLKMITPGVLLTIAILSWVDHEDLVNY